jgi:hypothetical protein
MLTLHGILTGAVCESSGTINLNTLITGTAGGTWSGTGVTGNTFNPRWVYQEQLLLPILLVLHRVRKYQHRISLLPLPFRLHGLLRELSAKPQEV